MFMRLNRAIFAVCITLSMLACSANGQPKGPVPAAKVDAKLAASPGKETAVFAGGCFWGTQSVFERVKGVLQNHGRILRRFGKDCDLQSGDDGNHGPCGVGRSGV